MLEAGEQGTKQSQPCPHGSEMGERDLKEILLELTLIMDDSPTVKRTGELAQSRDGAVIFELNFDD